MQESPNSKVKTQNLKPGFWFPRAGCTSSKPKNFCSERLWSRPIHMGKTVAKTQNWMTVETPKLKFMYTFARKLADEMIVKILGGFPNCWEFWYIGSHCAV